MENKHLLLFLATCIAVACGSASSVGYRVVDNPEYKLVAQSGQSALYNIIWEGNDQYDNPPQLINLVGDRYTMGYDYGYLLGNQIVNVYNKFLDAILGTSFFDYILRAIVENVIDWQWSSFLSKQVPPQYMEELRGIHDGGKAAGINFYNVDVLVSRVITLANAPGDLQNFILILLDEYNRTHGHSEAFQTADINRLVHVLHKAKQETRESTPFGHQCSMFSVWGSRTVNQDLYSCRNLDWVHGTGISVSKLITVFHPNDGSRVHATVGFAGVYGALTGMSASGIVVTEANLESDKITFFGMPWTIRLRWIMENADDLSSALALWAKSNNTVGFNHMIASRVDVPNTAAVCLETMAEYTAYFLDNDPREASATYNGERIGFPLKEALWRTNHGYDPVIRKHYLWSQSPTSWSMKRYLFAYEAFTSYERNAIKIGVAEAINITAILGDKGQEDPYRCQNKNSGSNILSVTFHPSTHTLYASWENGMGENWRPAACNIYVGINLSKFW